MIPIHSSIPFTADQIAEHLHGKVYGDGSVQLTGFATAENAKAGDLTFAEKQTIFLAAEESAATAILVKDDFVSSKKVVIRVPNARVAMARVLPLFFPPDKPVEGIHPSAVIDPAAEINETARIGPNCVVGPGVKIGARSVLMAGNYIGGDTQIGDDTRLYPNVVVYPRSQIGHRVILHAGCVIGSDGFGYVLDEGQHRKILQTGNVVIRDDVEIGANATVDCATFGSTVIGQGTKIDNLVQIAHNVTVGRNCIIMGQTGIAGSTHVGDYCAIGAQVGVLGHLKLGNQSMVGGKSGVVRDIPDGEAVLGYPAWPEKEAKRQWAGMHRLPNLAHRVLELEKQIEQMNAPKS
jgi:UDP-3-O-[3-hydroxymyristoyl] glucosamine N-acyltransferase